MASRLKARPLRYNHEIMTDAPGSARDMVVNNLCSSNFGSESGADSRNWRTARVS
jgi:hypothetical protein